jgi:hypothetical protein
MGTVWGEGGVGGLYRAAVDYDSKESDTVSDLTAEKMTLTLGL